MQYRKLFSTLAAGIALAATAAAAQAEIKIGVISSNTGPVALIGIPQNNTVPLLPKEIAGESVRYISYDDASDPSNTVTLIKKLITEDKVDAIIGPSSSPNAMASLDFIAEAKMPLLAPVGTIAIVLPMDEKRKWVFKTTQNDGLVADKLVGHMVKSGVKTLGFIGSGDTFGETWYGVMQDKLQGTGIEIVANERFRRPDTSVTGQALRVLGAKPDAVLIAAPGGPAVLPHATLKDMNYKGTFYQTHGAALNEFLKLGGAKVEDAIVAGSIMLAPDQAPDSNPAKKVALEYMEAYKKLHGNDPATFGGNVYDAGLLLQQAIPEALENAKPGTEEFRVALRDSLEKIKDLPGTQGIYNMTPEDHSGFDERGVELLTVKDGKWQLLK
ncbi:ABC transporter substrate-binding protein [Pusillimonas sp.]|uniref:ABC transporter substrate-binding protein n=1 Tax=Pusillimonas sp. TaxID=3040095 RepID=UPI0037CBA261